MVIRQKDAYVAMIQSDYRFVPSRLIIVAMLALVVALIGLFFDKAPLASAAQSDQICQVMLIVDRSGSIGEEKNTYKNAIKQLFKADTDAQGNKLGLYDENIYVGFWSFSDEATAKIKRGINNPSYTSYTVSTGRNANYTDFSKALDNALDDPYGATNYQQAFGFDGNTFNNALANDVAKADLIFFLTDGLPNAPNPTTADADGIAALQKLVNEKASDVDAVYGAFIKGQLTSSPGTVAEVIDKGVTKAGVAKGSINYSDFGSIIGGVNSLPEKVRFSCYTAPPGNPDPPIPPVDLRPEVKYTTGDGKISTSTPDPFTYDILNLSSTGARSAPTNWEIYREVTIPGLPSGPKVSKGSGTVQVPGSNLRLNFRYPISAEPTWPINTRVCDTLKITLFADKPPTERITKQASDCVTFIGHQSTFQVRGGDLYVGRHFKDFSSNNSTDSKVDGASPESFAEYGVFATGEVMNFSSGSAINAHPLTFANVGDQYGKFMDALEQKTLWIMPDIKNTILSGKYLVEGNFEEVVFNDWLKDDSEFNEQKVYRFDSELTTPIEVGPLNFGSKKRLIINAPNATVKIADDLRYDNGPYANNSEVPQIVIIAKNIEIDHRVTNVDAWLITQPKENGPNSVDGGVIETCVGSAADCSRNPLIINGPVVAYKLNLMRKYVDMSSSPRKPAEIFNLPASTYLYLLGKIAADNTPDPSKLKPQFETAWSIELPPYF